MKRLFALCGIVSSAVFLASMSVIVPYGALIVLIIFGGPRALLFGLGGVIFEFILGFILQGGLTPLRLLLGL